ncbi:site-specific recombinase XerD [Arcticibacter tournemirensis]|nr:site-specific integrase [Arcticibacter tournemirensis]TQM50024.1 site-specific recombinase XerD [Arcticibacter tournemirensis]
MQSYSVKLVVNKDRVNKKTGLCSLYLKVIINRKPIPIPMGLKWPLSFISMEKGCILPREKKDPDFRDYEMIIISELSKINEIFKIYRLQDKLLTPELFKKELKSFSRRKNFIAFMSQRITERYNLKQIGVQTKKNHQSTLNKLSEFKEYIAFHEIDKRFLEKFAGWLKTEYENEDATVWTRIKDVNTYLEIAEGEGIGVNSDYKKYQISSPKGRIIYLEDEEIDRLFVLFNSRRLVPTHHQVLRAFLFSCFTSLRISDIRLAQWGWVTINKEMQFVPYKTRSTKKEVIIPLSRVAESLIEKKTGFFFSLPTDQEMNRSLKDLAVLADIKKDLTFHVARHTFGSHYYRETKDIISLQKIMGHYKLDTTMIYVHINEQDKRDGIKKLDEAFMRHMPVRRLVG